MIAEFLNCYINKDNIEFWKLGSTIVLAGLAGLIAWRQAQTAQAKLDFDLFVRRELIYLVAKKFIEDVAHAAELDPKLFSKFRDERQAARWLLDQECWDYLEELENRGVAMFQASALMNGNTDMHSPQAERDEHSRAIKTRSQLRLWFIGQIAELPIVFAYQLTPQKAFWFPKRRFKKRVKQQRLVTQKSVNHIATIFGDHLPETHSQRLARMIKTLLKKVGL